MTKTTIPKKHLTNNTLDPVFSDQAKQLFKKWGVIQKSKHINELTDILSTGVILHRLHVDHCLSQNEKACLYWAAYGKTVKETASILFLSEGVVKFHRANILQKLNCKTIGQAIHRGFLHENLESTTINYISSMHKK